MKNIVKIQFRELHATGGNLYILLADGRLFHYNAATEKWTKIDLLPLEEIK